MNVSNQIRKMDREIKMGGAYIDDDYDGDLVIENPHGDYWDEDNNSWQHRNLATVYSREDIPSFLDYLDYEMGNSEGIEMYLILTDDSMSYYNGNDSSDMESYAGIVSA